MKTLQAQEYAARTAAAGADEGIVYRMKGV